MKRTDGREEDYSFTDRARPLAGIHSGNHREPPRTLHVVDCRAKHTKKNMKYMSRKSKKKTKRCLVIASCGEIKMNIINIFVVVVGLLGQTTATSSSTASNRVNETTAQPAMHPRLLFAPHLVPNGTAKRQNGHSTTSGRLQSPGVHQVHPNVFRLQTVVRAGQDARGPRHWRARRPARRRGEADLGQGQHFGYPPAGTSRVARHGWPATQSQQQFVAGRQCQDRRESRRIIREQRAAISFNRPESSSPPSSGNSRFRQPVPQSITTAGGDWAAEPHGPEHRKPTAAKSATTGRQPITTSASTCSRTSIGTTASSRDRLKEQQRPQHQRRPKPAPPVLPFIRARLSRVAVR